ncbi:MAG: acetate kinase [Firmicutes bacterium]|nr:acetate kinase [Bacillota bacterium]
MKILVINAGSSSMKYQLIDMNGEKMMAKGLCERIGIDGRFTHKTADGRVLKKEVPMKDHMVAFEQIKNALLDPEYGVIKDFSEISAVGHRVVQGGSVFSQSVLVDDKVIEQIEELSDLAPLHNPANAQGLRACRAVFGEKVPEVAVFDTAFHSTMPDYAYLYPVPYEYYEKYHVRRYGFHGTSHRFVSARCAELMGRPLSELKMITCHLGNGSSVTAIDHGKVIDTSMGLTPLDGFMMGTRTGTLDPSVVTFIAEKEGLSPKQMSDLLNKKSGMLGISGFSSDDRDIDDAAHAGNPRAILTQRMLSQELTKFVGGYIAELDGCDAIVFTAGVGENQPLYREKVCEHLSYMGVKIDTEKNNATVHGKEAEVSTPDSTVRVFVIPTNEELLIARDTMALAQEVLQK